MPLFPEQSLAKLCLRSMNHAKSRACVLSSYICFSDGCTPLMSELAILSNTEPCSPTGTVELSQGVVNQYSFSRRQKVFQSGHRNGCFLTALSWGYCCGPEVASLPDVNCLPFVPVIRSFSSVLAYPPNVPEKHN